MTHTPQFLEKFDLNQFHIAGQVQRVWSAGQDVMLRLRIDSPDRAENDIPAGRCTLRIPFGRVQDAPVTLMKGDWLTASGYLQEIPYVESGRQFAEKTRRTERLLADMPALAEVVTERMATCGVVHRIALCNPNGGSPAEKNDVQVEGIVCSVWSRDTEHYLRLAIYDCYTQRTDRPGKHGRPWRQAHYVSVHLPGGQAGGRAVRLRPKDRIRVMGRLTERQYSESLALFLMRAGQIGLLAEAPNAGELREMRVPRVATYVVADSLVQFTR